MEFLPYLCTVFEVEIPERSEAIMKKERIISFLWQHFLLLISLFIMMLGVAVSVRSLLGSSVISVLPYMFQEAGAEGLVPAWTIGQYTYLLNALLVLGQICVLRRRFEPIQFCQLLVGFVFGSFIDMHIYLTRWLLLTEIWEKVLAQFVGCSLLGFGISLEVRCGSVTMPGDGFPVAVSRVSGAEFAKVKISIDTSLVVLGIIASYTFFGEWKWHIIGIGTLFAMYYVGWMVRLVSRHIAWFDRVLRYRPGFRRYLYGLARYLYGKR